MDGWIRRLGCTDREDRVVRWTERRAKIDGQTQGDINGRI